MGKKYKNWADWRTQENMYQYNFYFKRFKRLLLSMFRWDNLPDGITSRFIEENLFYNGCVVFYKSKLGIIRASNFNILRENTYNEPSIVKTYCNVPLEIDDRFLKSDDCVFLWNDLLRDGNISNVNFFTKRLTNIEKTIDCDLEHMKHPYIISAPEGKIGEVKRIIKDTTEGLPYIVEKSGAMTSQQFDYSVFNFNVPTNVSDLQDIKHEIINEALTFFGVNNVNVIKKERLVSGETNQNNQEILLNRSSMFIMRENFCKEVNKKFDLNISVEISENAFSEIMSFYNVSRETLKKDGENIE